MLKADLHTHTSEDPYDKGFDYDARGLIERAASLGFEVLSVTNHCRVTYDSSLAEFAKSRGVLLIPGCEQEIEGKHVLLYNITEKERAKVRNFDDLETLRQSKGKSMLVVAAHPYLPARASVKDIPTRRPDLFDAIEITQYDHPLFGHNKKTMAMAKSLGKPLLWSSDSHNLRYFGKHYTMIDAKPKVEDVLAAIRSGKTKGVVPRFPLEDLVKIGGKVMYYRLLAKLGFHEGHAF